MDNNLDSLSILTVPEIQIYRNGVLVNFQELKSSTNEIKIYCEGYDLGKVIFLKVDITTVDYYGFCTSRRRIAGVAQVDLNPNFDLALLQSNPYIKVNHNNMLIANGYITQYHYTIGENIGSLDFSFFN